MPVFRIHSSQREPCNREGTTGILAFFATLPSPRHRANVTIAATSEPKSSHAMTDLFITDLSLNDNERIYPLISSDDASH